MSLIEIKKNMIQQIQDALDVQDIADVATKFVRPESENEALIVQVARTCLREHKHQLSEKEHELWFLFVDDSQTFAEWKGKQATKTRCT